MLKLATATSFAVLSAMVIGACGSDPDAAESSGTDGTGVADSGVKKKAKKVVSEDDAGVADSGRPAAWTPSFPQVLSYGGKVIASPKVRPIVYKSDPTLATIQKFTDQIAVSDYWKTLGAEYGVGPMTSLPAYVVNEAAPALTTSDAVLTWLTSKLSGASPAFGTPDPNTLYALYYPPGTIVKDNAQGESCKSYGAYHSELTVNGVTVGYSLHPHCASFGGTSELDSLTVGASHEYFEWATDPFPATGPAYTRLDDAHWAWGIAMFGELGDLCTYIDRSSFTTTGIDFTVQRMWSNAAAAAGNYPCAPTSKTTYLQAIPRTEDDVRVYDLHTQKPITTKGIHIEPGETRDVDVMIYSDSASTEDVELANPYRLEQFNPYYSTSGFTAYLLHPASKIGDFATIRIKAPAKANVLDVLTLLSRGADAETSYYWSVTVATDDGKSVLVPSFEGHAGNTLPARIRPMKPVGR